MDQILKARKLGSAAARRRKMQEREVAMQLDEERRTKILLYGYSSEEDESSDDDANTYSPIPDSQSDRLRPISRLSTVSKNTSTTISIPPSEQIQASSYPFPLPPPCKSYIPEIVIPQPLSPDFRTYQIESTLPEDDVDAEAETPIEIATPILYSIPRARPSMISIKINIKPPHRPASLPHPPPLPRKSEKRVSAMSARSASSPVELPTISLPSFSEQVSNSIRCAGNNVVRRRPVTISAKSESALQNQVPSYDVFPRRSKVASSRRIDQAMIREEQPQKVITAPPQIVVNTRRTSSFPTAPREPEPRFSTSPPPEVHNKKPTATLRQRRSSIGLALRNASSPFRSKNTNNRPDTSSSGESVKLIGSIDISAFPMPPPSPLFQQSFLPQAARSPEKFNGSDRMRRVRTTIGL